MSPGEVWSKYPVERQLVSWAWGEVHKKLKPTDNGLLPNGNPKPNAGLAFVIACAFGYVFGGGRGLRSQVKVGWAFPKMGSCKPTNQRHSNPFWPFLAAPLNSFWLATSSNQFQPASRELLGAFFVKDHVVWLARQTTRALGCAPQLDALIGPLCRAGTGDLDVRVGPDVLYQPYPAGIRRRRPQTIRVLTCSNKVCAQACRASITGGRAPTKEVDGPKKWNP